MDLLKGYGSDDSSSSSSDDEKNNAKVDSVAPATTAAAPPKVASGSQKTKRGGGGKRILSLGAVLPPEIFDRLTRPPDEDDSSASSSFDGADVGNKDNNGGAQSKSMKKRKRYSDNHNEPPDNSKSGAGDRTELNSLLNELRSTPMHVSTKKSASKDGGLKKEDNGKGGKLGMAFMSVTSSTRTSNKGNDEVVDIHAARQSAQPKYEQKISKEVGERKAPPMKFSRLSAAAPVVPQYSQASMPEYPVASSQAPENMNDIGASVTTASGADEAQSYMQRSRKQRRDEERALRSGQAFRNKNSTTAATEIHQPSPTEFAPTAHAAAVASNAARVRGIAAGGGGSVKNIAMYDPSSGGDLKGLGVTGKHRSKHQINQLMASAISLEAHRASETELARFGAGGGGSGKGSSSRADAKRKYGW